MKKLLAFAVCLFTLAFPTQFVFAADTSPGPNTAPMLNPWAVVNSNNTVTVFWNQIENVQQYRVCINEECPAKWNEYKPSENSATFPLGINETKSFWVHAFLTNDATNYNTLDLRPCCNGVKWADSFKRVTASNIAVPIPTTTAVPETTTTVQENKIVLAKLIKQKNTITTTTILATTSAWENPTDAWEKWKKSNPSYFIPKQTVTKTQKEFTMFGLKENEFFVIATLFLIAFIYIIAAQMNRWKIQKMRFQLEMQSSKVRLDLEVKEKEFNFESKSYELKELAKSKLNNEHEVALKKINSSATTDQLEFTERQLSNERNHNLEQQRINANNADKILEYVMPIVQKRDAHELRMAEIKSESTLGSIIETNDIKSGTVKLNIKK